MGDRSTLFFFFEIIQLVSCAWRSRMDGDDEGDRVFSIPSP